MSINSDQELLEALELVELNSSQGGAQAAEAHTGEGVLCAAGVTAHPGPAPDVPKLAPDVPRLAPGVPRRARLGLASELSAGGANLSLGDRQLLCLIRALLRYTRVLVLDDVAALVDNETEEIIRKVLQTKVEIPTIVNMSPHPEKLIHCNRFAPFLAIILQSFLLRVLLHHSIDIHIMFHPTHSFLFSAPICRILMLDGGKMIDFDTPEKLSFRFSEISKALTASKRATSSRHS